MSTVYDWHQGTSPLLISIPHDGRRIPPRIEERMTEAGAAIPDTDWHVRQLYEFAKLSGASILAAKYSRYVIDLNRPSNDESLYANQTTTSLCPLETFQGDPIYADGKDVSEKGRARRIARYWQPYHDRLAQALRAIRKRFGYALLWDAHSIRGELPRLFEGTLPDLNIGSHDGRSCPETVTRSVAGVATASPYTSVVNGRFKGGYITRHYGRPEDGVYALQLELAQRCYMDESTLRYDAKRALRLGETLRQMLAAYQSSAASAVAAAGEARDDKQDRDP